MKCLRHLAAAFAVGAVICGLVACQRNTNSVAQEVVSAENLEGTDGESSSMELEYAECFSVDEYEGATLVTINQKEQYVLVQDLSHIPAGLPETAKAIEVPVQRVYLAASSAMDFFLCLDSFKNVAAVSTKEDDWSFSVVKDAMERKEIAYVGKYSAPDFEQLLSKNCDLAVESTMISHSPEIAEQLKKSGIPVFTEYSSYEPHPLGRLEWVKLYGLLLGKKEEAEQYFVQQKELVDSMSMEENTEKTVVFFYLTSNNSVNVRKPGDYISRMIEMAGGQYLLEAKDLHVDEDAQSTINMQFETFYALAKDADILIYNSTVDGGLDTMQHLMNKHELLKDFKAVQIGNVWCAQKNMFQETTKTAEMISDFYQILHEEKKELSNLRYLRLLK